MKNFIKINFHKEIAFTAKISANYVRFIKSSKFGCTILMNNKIGQFLGINWLKIIKIFFQNVLYYIL